MSRLRCTTRSVAALVSALAASAALVGCTVGPEYETPDVVLPAEFRSGSEATADGDAENKLLQWWVGFGDPTLTALVERALAENLDLEAAAARIERSRALLGLSRADLLPSAIGSGEATRSRQSEEVQGGPAGAAGTNNTFGLNLSASWELDVFGGRRRAVQAARAELEAVEADGIATRVAVTGEVADAYLARQGALDRLRIAEENVASFRDTVGLTSARLSGGLVSELDTALAQADLDAALADLPALRTEVALQEHRLAAVLGITPTDVVPLLDGASSVADAPAIDGRGVPLDLLRRRPDVIAAERRIAAASATIGEQVAEYFPRLTLNGAIGVSSSDADTLMRSSAGTWLIGPSFQWRLLDFARVDATVNAARADERLAIAEYCSAVVDAVRDAEDAAVRFDNAGIEVEARRTALASRERALRVAMGQYNAGLSEFLPVLDAQRGVNRARTELTASRERRVRAAVALYRALGGGWGA